MTNKEKTQARINHLLTTYKLSIETEEDRKNYEMFNALPDMAKLGLLAAHSPAFRQELSDISWEATQAVGA